MLENNRIPRLPALLIALFIVVLLPLVRPGAASAGPDHRLDAVAAASPEQPRVLLDTTYAPPAGNTITVNSGDDLQAALTAAQPGDTITLQAGATFTGNFVLPNKTGSGWIYIQTSAYGSLPAPGTRVSPTNAASMPKIVSPNTIPAISTDTGAHNYRFVGIEITTTHATTDTTQSGLAVIGNDTETNVNLLPHDITFDRSYIHGTPTGNIRRGVTANSARTAVVDSYISDIHEVGADTQAIGAWSGPGPFKIVNNRLEAAGENVLFGGADTPITNLVPSDIEVRHNYFFKPLSWKVDDPSYAGIHWSVKNLFELKNAQRVLADGNVFQNNWADAQSGFGILFTPRNQDGTNPWAVVQDVTFTHNVLRNSDNGFNCSGTDDINSSQQTKRILIKDNIVEGAQAGAGDGSFRLYQILNGNTDFTVDHNTAINIRTHVIVFDVPELPNTNLVYTNNISNRGEFGVFGSGVGEGSAALDTYAPGADFRRNVIAGGASSIYPPDNFFPAALTDVGFADLAGGDYHLVSPSPFIGQGTDGKDVGADINALNAATQGVTTGQ